jgi:cytochrome c peroxidase
VHVSGGDPAAIARGKQLFESSSVGCATCHRGAALTNNLTVDVGTGGHFQVPSLLGLALRSPFMHDGCAKTPAERFDPG